MERTYRVEIQKANKKSFVLGYFYTTLEKIRGAMENQLIYKGGIINVYAKTGKKVLTSFAA